MDATTDTLEQLAGRLQAFALDVADHIAEVALLGPGKRNAMGIPSSDSRRRGEAFAV